MLFSYLLVGELISPVELLDDTLNEDGDVAAHSDGLCDGDVVSLGRCRGFRRCLGGLQVRRVSRERRVATVGGRGGSHDNCIASLLQSHPQPQPERGGATQVSLTLLVIL
jgi:hypothetical protein